MPNDPLPLPNILATPLSDAGYEAIHAELIATPPGRSFLVEYANRRLDPDTHRLVGTIARLDAAMRDDRPLHLLAALARGLADFATAIEQIEAVLPVKDIAAADIHFAVERIQDMVMAPRQRDVAPPLCDTLEAAIRDIGDAIARGDAAAARVLSAVALLRDLARGVNDMAALATNVDARSLQQAPEPAPRPLDESQEAGRAADHDDETVNGICAAESSVSAEAAVAAADGEPPLSPPPRPMPAKKTPATSPVPRAVLDDPLAALRALSDEELIALFS